MNIPRISLKAAIAVVLVLGTVGIMLQLGRGAFPQENRDLFNIALGSWLTWGGMAVKRLFDSTESSDLKNATINAQAAALATATQPASDSQ